MRDIEIALAVSTRRWSEHLHRFLADHGGARVRLHVMRPHDAFSEKFDVLLIDDICSFLSPRLVEKLVRKGRKVVGVYSPSEFPDGKDRLLDCCVTEVIESDAPPEEFLALVEQLEIDRHPKGEGPPETVEEGCPDHVAEGAPLLVAVGSPPGGCGATEVSIGLARRLAEQYGEVGLLDLDQRAPSVAQRLGLALYPNLLTAIDAVHHHSDSLESCWQTPRGSNLRVLSGVPGPADRMSLRQGEVAEVLLETIRTAEATVVNFGHWDIVSGDRPFWDVTGTVSDAVLGIARALVGVALPSPVGMARMIEWIGNIRERHPAIAVQVVVNRAPGSLSIRRSLFEELCGGIGQVQIAFLPEDRLVAEAAWNGVLVERGKFRRGCDRLADRLLSREIRG